MIGAMTRQAVWCGVATGVALAALTSAVALIVTHPDPAAAAYLAAAAAIGAWAITSGWLVLRHAPGNAVAPILCAMGLAPVGMALLDLLGEKGPGDPALRGIAGVVAVATGGVWIWLYVPPALLLLVFPTGRPATRLWGTLLRAVVVVATGFTLLAAAAGLGGETDASGDTVAGLVALVLLLGFFGLLCASCAAVFVRYRRHADAGGRRQLKWLMLAGLTLPLTLLLCWVSYLLLANADLVLVGLTTVWIAVPLATWIAITRHNLYDVDRLTSAAIVSGAGVIVVTAAAATASVLVGVAFGGPSTVVTATVAAAAALVFGLLQRRARHLVDRWAYPQRWRAMRAIDDLSAAVSLGTADPMELERRLRTALDEPDLRVRYGADAEPAGTGIRIGDETVATMAGTAHTAPSLLGRLARACAPLADLARLRLQLQDANREADAARRRLSSATGAERQRLERDLHDGAQQRLISLGMSLRIAQRHTTDPEVDALIDASVAEIGTAVAELRSLAHGIRPSGLDQGLAVALGTQLLAAPIPISVHVHGPDPGDDLALTAYYIVTEAVSNALKHAEAASVIVDVERTPDVIRVLVEDDGRGGADATGSGIQGLSDRITAIGGALTVQSAAGAGTRIEAVIPCAS